MARLEAQAEPMTPALPDDPEWVIGRFRSVAGWPMMVIDTDLWVRRVKLDNCILESGSDGRN